MCYRDNLYNKKTTLIRTRSLFPFSNNTTFLSRPFFLLTPFSLSKPLFLLIFYTCQTFCVASNHLRLLNNSTITIIIGGSTLVIIITIFTMCPLPKGNGTGSNLIRTIVTVLMAVLMTVLMAVLMTVLMAVLTVQYSDLQPCSSLQRGKHFDTNEQ